MSISDIPALPLREKLQILELIWDDLRRHVEKVDAPKRHQEILDSRQQRVDSGEATLQDWDTVKHRIGRQ